MRIRRKTPLLNDAIEALAWRLSDTKHALPKATIEEQTNHAWSLLSNLELEFVKQEIASCVDSRMYYIENYHTIQAESGQIMGLYPCWDLQWLVEEAIVKERAATGQSRVVVLKPRQAGITEYANAVMCWCTFFTPNAYTMTVAQDPFTAAHVQRKVNIAWDNLPWWLRPERLYHNRGEFLEFGRKDMTERAINPGLGSIFVTTHAQRNTGVAIGKTVRNLHLTEVSRWASGEIYSSDIQPSMNAIDTMAIAESTAYGSSGFYHNLWQGVISEGEDSDWRAVFLPAYKARKFSLPLKPKQLPFILDETEAAMRERVAVEERFHITDEFFNWRRRRLRDAIRDTGYPYAFYESYPTTPEEAFQSSGDAAFPRHKLDEQGQRCVRRPNWIGEIIYTGMNAAPKLLLNVVTPESLIEKREHHNRLWLWEKPDPREIYYIGVDCASGNGPDFSVAEIFRAGAGLSPDVQVGEWVGLVQPEAWAKICYALGSLYNKAEIAVEYAKEGMITANMLMNELEYPNLYRPRSRDRMGNQLASYLHWQTTSKTKPLIMAKMSETLLEDGIVIRSSYLLNELKKAGKDGSSFSGVDAHDDAAMAGCITLFCLRETMPELRVQASSGDAGNQAPTVGARASGGASVYGIYDQWFRLRGQTQNLAAAEEFIEKHPGYQLKQIMVTKANTAYSVIHHERGLENELYRQGVDSGDITPSMVAAYKEATGRAEHLSVYMQAGQGPARNGGVAGKVVLPPGALVSARVPLNGQAEIDAAWLNGAVSGSMFSGELG